MVDDVVAEGCVAETVGAALPGRGAFGAIARPNLKVFDAPMFTEKNRGPCAKLCGIIFSSGVGFGSKAPYGVKIMPGLFGLSANAGRSENDVSPFVSRPVVMLNGRPELAMMKLLTLQPDFVE